jgi:hypothetical protein
MHPEILTVYARDHLAPGASALVLIALCCIAAGLLLFSLREWLRARAAAREAAAIDAAGPLREHAVFISGKVALAQGERVAMRVTVKQTGTEHTGSKGQKSWKWTEASREQLVRPFYIVHASGARVRVEPQGAQVHLIDALDQRHWESYRERYHRAELTPGEFVIAEGIVRRGHDPEIVGGEGYRDGAQGWVLGPLAGRIHLSSEDLARRHALRARAFKRMLGWLPAALALSFLPLGTFLWRAVAGESVLATYTGRTSWTSRSSKGRIVYHYALTYEVPPAALSVHESGVFETGRIEVSEDDYRLRLPDGGQLSQIWLRRVPGHPMLTSTGPKPTVNYIPALFSLGLMCAVGYQVRKRHVYRRWYEGEMNEEGKGPMPSPSDERFAEAP